MTAWDTLASTPLGKQQGHPSSSARLNKTAKGRAAARKAYKAGICPQCGGEGFDPPDLTDSGAFYCRAKCGYMARLDRVRYSEPGDGSGNSAL